MKTKLSNWAFATISARAKTGYTYAAPTYPLVTSAGGREYKASPKGDVKSISANSQEVYVCETNDGYEIELTLIDTIDAIEELEGYTVVTNGILETASETENPRFALILSDDATTGSGKTEIFYDCVVTSRAEIAGKTSEEGKWDAQFVTLKIKASPRLDNKNVRLKISGTTELQAVPEPTTTPPKP